MNDPLFYNAAVWIYLIHRVDYIQYLVFCHNLLLHMCDCGTGPTSFFNENVEFQAHFATPLRYTVVRQIMSTLVYSKKLASLLLVPQNRLDALHTMRSSLLAPLLSAREAPPKTSQVSRFLDYYPPDVNVHKLAQQDTSLSALNLVDVKLEAQIERERFAEERGKPVRVSAVDGLRPALEKESKKKKKR